MSAKYKCKLGGFAVCLKTHCNIGSYEPNIVQIGPAVPKL